jgi:hypothetical protein
MQSEQQSGEPKQVAENPKQAAQGPEPATTNQTESQTTKNETAVENPGADTRSPAALPDFICTVRGYGGGGYDDFQINNLKELGVVYVHGIPNLNWNDIEPSDDGWKWGGPDEQMDKLAAYGLKSIPFVMIPKLEGLHGNLTITRTDSKFVEEYEEYAYELVKRYRNHSAWSGLVAVWGGSADVWDHAYNHTDPEVVVPLLNAAYRGIKRADPNTTVIGFNFATTAHSKEDWEEFHRRAFVLSPQFDWYGVQSHGVLTTAFEGEGAYTGAAGLMNVRKFLDAHGYADKPIFVNEGGFTLEQFGGSEEMQAEQVVETYVVVRGLDANVTGWAYFDLFEKTVSPEEGTMGLMSALAEHDPPQPRQSWYAMQTLIKTVKFFDYDLDAKLSGEYNKTAPPFVYRFVHQNGSSSKLWVVFSPRLPLKGQEPVEQDVPINISPATQATVIGMLGNQSIVTADASGNIVVTSTSSPIYVKT